MAQFLLRLIGPRPTFPADITPAEAALMKAHAAYWFPLVEKGTCMVFGPVLDPAGAWGLAIVETETVGEARQLMEKDPSVIGGLNTFAVAPMQVSAMRKDRTLAG
jgi:uncharacterized protein YciI